MLSAAFTHTLFDATLCAEGSWLLQMLPMEMFGKTSNYSNYHNEPVSPRGLPAAVQVHGGYANSIERHYTRIGAAAAAGTAGILLCVVLCCVCLVCVLCVLCVFVRCVVCCVLFILSILSHEESHARLFTPWEKQTINKNAKPEQCLPRIDLAKKRRRKPNETCNTVQRQSYGGSLDLTAPS
jgi:hypothetical protein